MKHLASLSVFLLLFFSFLPIFVYAECSSETESEEIDKAGALRLKLIAIATILVLGAVGVSIPILGKIFPFLSPESNFFFIIKAFAAGVILATGFVHVLPDAFNSLTNPRLSKSPWQHFPFTGLVAMFLAIGTLMVDTFATSYYTKSHYREAAETEAAHQVVSGDEEKQGEHEVRVHVYTHATHGHAHGSAFASDHAADKIDVVRHRIISQVLELGIVVHSVIIGIALGTYQSPKKIKPLVAALTFHQFFEGMGLGSCISQSNLKVRVITIMGIFFSLTTPVGIAIGYAISNKYNENSPTALIVQGLFNSASAGILIYMALVDFLATDFRNPRLQGNFKLQLGSNFSLLMGAGLMSLMARWA